MITGKTKTIHSVFAAFKLIDDFAGKAITDATPSFFVNNQRVLPLRKSDGIYVLTNLQLDNASINIQAPNYCPRIIDAFTPSSGIGTSRIIPVRLHPGVNYPIKSGTTAYSAEFINKLGQPLIGAYIQIFSPLCNDTVKFKALKTINDTKVIVITNAKGLDFTGLTLTVPANKPASEPIIFNVLSKIDNMTFEIAALSEKQIPFEEAIVKRVYSSFTNSHGQVLIPLELNSNLGTFSESDERAVELYVYPSEHIWRKEQKHIGKLSKSLIHKEILLIPGSIKYFKEEVNI